MRTIGDLVYAVLTGNPTLAEDGVALFHASHGNLPTGSVISTSSVDGVRGHGQAEAAGPDLWRLQHPPEVPAGAAGLEGLARTVADSEFEVGSATRTTPRPTLCAARSR